MTTTPPTYSHALAKQICEHIAEGETLTAVCEPADMPTVQDVIRWEQEDPEIASMFDIARKARAELLFDRTLETIDRLERGDITAAQAEVTIEGLKLLVETCDAYAPRKFIVHEGEVTLILPDGSEALLRPSGLTVMATGVH